MRFETREERLDKNYRKVEAIFRRGVDIDSIARNLQIDRIDVLDIVQKIVALDIQRESRRTQP